MPPGAALVGGVFVLTGIGLLGLLREPTRQPDKPGSRWFALTVVGIALWPASLGVSYLLTDLGLTTLAWSGRAVAAALISVSWFLLAVEYTTRRRPPRLLIGALAAYVLVDLALTATNPLHHLLLTEATAQAGTVLVPDYGPWFWARTVFNYALIILATALLAVEWSGTSGIQRRQSAILALAVVPPVIANLLTLVSLVPSAYDLTPFGLAGSGILLTWALYRVEFLEVVPVARETAMEEMRDAVVTLDGEGRVVDCNAAARELFDVDEDYAGTAAGDFFSDLPEDVQTSVAAGEELETRATLHREDGPRHYSVSVSPVSVRDAVAGRVVVLRDVTPLRAREQALEERQQELDLLRQVLTRVLRHNLRNALTTINGNAESLARDLQGEDRERAQRIVGASDGLLAISEKAGHVERIAAEGQPMAYDLVRVVSEVLEDVRREYPDVTFEADLPDSASVRAGRGLDVAVEALLENAAEYANDREPHVTVAVDTSGPVLTVADNGDGIPTAEVRVLDAEEETPLAHGSGIGLWLAKWVADHAGAELRFDADGGGTTVSMDFEVDAGPVSHDPGTAAVARDGVGERPSGEAE